MLVPMRGLSCLRTPLASFPPPCSSLPAHRQPPVMALEQSTAKPDHPGVHVVIDPVGGPLFNEALKSVAWGAHIIVIGFAAGGIPKVGFGGGWGGWSSASWASWSEVFRQEGRRGGCGLKKLSALDPIPTQRCGGFVPQTALAVLKLRSNHSTQLAVPQMCPSLLREAC